MHMRTPSMLHVLAAVSLLQKLRVQLHKTGVVKIPLDLIWNPQLAAGTAEDAPGACMVNLL